MPAFSSFCEFSCGDVRLAKNDFPKSGESVGKLWPKVRKKGKYYVENIIYCQYCHRECRRKRGLVPLTSTEFIFKKRTLVNFPKIFRNMLKKFNSFAENEFGEVFLSGCLIGNLMVWHENTFFA